MAQRLHGLGQRHALRQQQAHTPVARQITRAGEHQVTQARQPHKGVHARPQGEAQPGDFGQAARDQGCTGIEPQRQAVAQARGNGQHVLHGTAHFHARYVGVFVHAQGTAMESLHQELAQGGIAAGGDQGAGLATRHLHGKAGATEDTRTQGRCHLGTHFMSQQAIGLAQRRGLKALAQPRHGRSACLQLGQPSAQCRHGRPQHHQIGLLAQGQRIATGHAQGRRKAHPLEVARVLAGRLHGAGLGSIARPQRHVMACGMGRRCHGHCRAPCACANNYYFHSL